MTSPSVWAGATWKQLASSPLRWNVSESSKVTIGHAPGGAAGMVSWAKVRNCVTVRRRRALSWAMITAPAAASFSLPPVWSPCQWVLSTKRIGLPPLTESTAARSLSESGAN